MTRPRPGLTGAVAAMCAAVTLLAACNQTPHTQAPAPTATAPAPNAPLRALVAFTAAPPSAQVSFSLEGCRNDGSPVITLPNSGGKFICPDAAYTSGNLGKGWNELDLVPHRLTASVGNQTNATTTFSVILAADFQLGTKTGYDVVTVPEINAAKSDASCQITVQDQQTGGSVTGGADTVVYRTVNITLNRGKTCVIDYANRLALGAAQYSGSSLQAYMFEKSDFSTGKRTIPLPVREIQPQTIAKEMSASQGRDQVWDVIKQPTPATLNFGDVCAPGAVTEKAVQIRVAWEIVNVVPGNVTLLTRIYATNPAARVITVDVTDRMYRGTDQSQGVLDSASSGPKDVPANTANVLILSHTYSLVTTDLLVGSAFNDVATATYTDKVTGIPVPGSTTATASTTVSAGTVTNASAAIADSESISGSALTFAVAPTTLGSFSGYTPGTFVTGPVNWSVAGQTAAGSVTFDKTVRLGSRVVTSGALSDTAILTGSDGFSDSASASIDISSAASVSLTIRKTIPDILQAGESQTFTFAVKNNAGATVATPSVTFAAGQTTRSVTVSNLDPGAYTVSEQAESGWATHPDQSTTIALPSCSGSVTFNNAIVPAQATVAKTTVPAGGQQGWEFRLLNADTNAVVTTGTTDASGTIAFQGDLAEGNYAVVETAQTGYDLTASTGCTFSVNYPADAGKTFTCAATNTRRGHIVIRKVTNPTSSTQGFEFTPSYGGATPFTLKHGESSDSGLLVPGTYRVSEAVPAGWLQTSATCDDGSPVTAIALGAGETVTCTFTNTKQPRLTVIKTVVNEYGGTKAVTDFTLKVDGSTVTSGTATQQTIGTHTVSEVTPLPYGYTQDSIGGDCDASGKITLAAGDDKTCTITNSDSPASIVVIKNAKPASGSFAFTTTGSGFSSFTLSGATTGGGNVKTTSGLGAGTYTVRETTQLGWLLTGIGGSADPSTPYNCLVTGSGGSSGVGDLNTATASITLRMGDTVTCTFENTGNGVTRTQGFWATHPNLALMAWAGGTGFSHTFPGVAGTPGIGDQLLCGRTVTAGSLGTALSSDVMGAFWSGISKTTLGKARSSLDQARMQLLQQLIAAELNASAFGSVPGSGSFAAWEAAYCGTNAAAISTAQQQAASFNTSGDSGTFTPGTSASSKLARSIANLARWNVLP